MKMRRIGLLIIAVSIIAVSTALPVLVTGQTLSTRKSPRRRLPSPAPTHLNVTYTPPTQKRNFAIMFSTHSALIPWLGRRLRLASGKLQHSAGVAARRGRVWQANRVRLRHRSSQHYHALRVGTMPSRKTPCITAVSAKVYFRD